MYVLKTVCIKNSKNIRWVLYLYFMGLKGFCLYMYKSKFLFNVYMNHNRIPPEWDLKGLLY